LSPPTFIRLGIHGAVCVVLAGLVGTGWAEPRDGEGSQPSSAGTRERILSVEADYEIRRDGTVLFEQRFLLLVAGETIRHGPVLNYLTAFRGPGGLILDSGLEVLEASRNGVAEPFRAERSEGFVSLFLGSSEHALEHGEHAYLVRGVAQGDWRRGEGVFNATIDLAGPLPALPIEGLRARVRLPEGVEFRQQAVAVTGASREAEQGGPAVVSGVVGPVLELRTTAPLGVDRSAFVNLSWPTAGFATKSQWPKVLSQHPRIPLAAGSSLLLLWALASLVARQLRRVA
jgi:hypothetical protein